MKFSDWKLLNENISIEQLTDEAEKLKELISKELNELDAIPDFEVFSRPGEPDQHNNLFIDKDANTFAVNYTVRGDLFSVDFWKKSEHEPFVTYYIGAGTIEDLAEIIPDIIKHPEEALKKRTHKIQTPKDKVLENEDAELEITSSKPKPKTIIKTIDGYKYSDPATIFDDLRVYINMVIEGVQPSLVITGNPGVGKTYEILDQFKKANLKKGRDYLYIKGRSTAAGLYVTLYENRDRLIVFDDCDSVLKNPDCINIIKGAVDSYDERQVSWLTAKVMKTFAGKQIPKTFTFTGRIIFISNLTQKEIDDAIKSRSFVLEVSLTPEDMLEKMKNELVHVFPELSMIYKQDAYDLIKMAYKKGAVNLRLDMRTLDKAIKIVKYVDDMSKARNLIIQQCSYK